MEESFYIKFAELAKRYPGIIQYPYEYLTRIKRPPMTIGMMTSSYRPASNPDNIIRRLLSLLHDNPEGYRQEVDRIMNSLNKEGVKYVIEGMAKYLKPEIQEKVVEEVVEKVPNTEILFEGVPQFKIEVRDLDPDYRRITPYNGDHSKRYELYLIDQIDGEAYKVSPNNSNAFIFYMWFLLQPRCEFTKAEITERRREFIELQLRMFKTYDKVTELIDEFQYNTNIENKDETPRSEKMGVQTGMDSFVTTSVSKIKLNQGLFGSPLPREDNLNWYIVSSTRTDKKYSIALPEDYIIIPESLKRFREKFMQKTKPMNE